MKFGRVDVVIWTYKAQGSKPSFWKDVKTTGANFKNVRNYYNRKGASWNAVAPIKFCKGHIYRRKYGYCFSGPQYLLESPYYLFLSQSPKLHVASNNACRHFRRFQVLFSKPILLYGFHGATFSKVSRESRNFPMVNLKFTGSTYSLYLCINVLLTKFSLQKTSSLLHT